MTMRQLCTLVLTAALLPSLAHAHGPSRQKVKQEVTVNAPADKVWDMLADFCAIEQWHPAVAKCEGDGGNEIGVTRVLYIGAADGPQIHEELQKFDAEKMSMKYKITKTDNAVLPVTTYSAILKVMPNDDGTSVVSWKTGFYRAYTKNDPPPELNDESAVTAVTGVVEAGLASIKALAEK